MSDRLPSLTEFAQLRRGMPVLAALLLVCSLTLPMWSINVHAVQYPNEVLRLHLFAYPHISGDYVEMARLNQYIGFYYPDPVYWLPNYEPHPTAVEVPEWSLGPLAFLAVAGASAFVAFAPTGEKLKRGLGALLVGSVAVFTVMVADIQYRLYQTGHSLDPDAPVMGVDPFTPPIWGKYEVANITSYSRLGTGAYLTMLAIALLFVAFVYRDAETTFGSLPGDVRSRLGGVRASLPGPLGTGNGGSRRGDDDPVTRPEEGRPE